MQQGLSLIELLIVLAVTGILAAIAYPAYNEQLRRAARSADQPSGPSVATYSASGGVCFHSASRRRVAGRPNFRPG